MATRSITGLSFPQDINTESLNLADGGEITIEGATPSSLQFLGYDPTSESTKYMTTPNTTYTAGRGLSLTNTNFDCIVPDDTYQDNTNNNVIVKVFTPTDFMNDNDNNGYNRSVIADTGRVGYAQIYSGTQAFVYFTIPTGYKWTKYYVRLENSSGTPQNGGNTTLYTQPFSKRINGEFVSLVNAPINKVFNSEVNLDSQLSSRYNSSTTHSSIVADIDMGLIMVYRLYNWSSAFYFGGGYAVFEYEGVPDP